MIPFLLKRIGWMVLTLWAVFTLSFFVMRLSPGGPFVAEKQLPPIIEQNINRHYGLHKPLIVQYFSYLGKVVVGQSFGPSMRIEDYTVDEIITEGFPVSASLGIFAMIFALTIGMTAGVISAARRHSFVDHSFMAMATLGIAIPNFVLASLAIVLFVFVLDIVPAAGWGSLAQFILPALCLAAPFAAYIARLTRTGMMEVLGLDYIRTAMAKGLSERRVVLRHAIRGAILPVVSYIGPAVAGILSGSLVLEKIFAIPGLGSHFIFAVTQRDYPLALGMVMVYTFLLFVMNTLVDISYSFIDPRVKLEP